jgi:hypothetical protein
MSCKCTVPAFAIFRVVYEEVTVKTGVHSYDVCEIITTRGQEQTTVEFSCTGSIVH